MTIDEAAGILLGMYEQGLASGESRTQVHLFGIKYAVELESFSIKELDDIGFQATGGRAKNYGTEIDKGRKLARYVVVRSGV